MAFAMTQITRCPAPLAGGSGVVPTAWALLALMAARAPDTAAVARAQGTEEFPSFLPNSFPPREAETRTGMIRDGNHLPFQNVDIRHTKILYPFEL